MQWKEENRALFAACLNGLEDEPMVRAMDAIPQHVKGVSCYDHCLFVAYVGFTLCRIFGLDYRAAARAGLLHDLYLQNGRRQTSGASGGWSSIRSSRWKMRAPSACPPWKRTSSASTCGR